MSGKKSNRKSDPQLNIHWEICKNFLSLYQLITSEKELKQFRNSIASNKKLSKSIIPKIINLISKFCRSSKDYEEISQGLDSFLIILETLIKSSRAKFTKLEILTFFNDLFALTIMRSSNTQGKINTLALFLDNLMIMILNGKDVKDSSKEIFEHFLLFLEKFSDFTLIGLLEGSVSMRESLNFNGTDFEKSHFLEYVLLIILSLSKYHDLNCEFQIGQKLFETILWLLEKPEQVQYLSKVYFIVNNLVLALGILASLSKAVNEKKNVLIANEDRVVLLIVQGCCSLAEIEIFDVPLTPMNKNPFVISKLFSLLLNIVGHGDGQTDCFIHRLFLEILKNLKKNWKKLKNGCQGVILFHILEFFKDYFFVKNNQHPNTLGVEKLLLHPVWFLQNNEEILKIWEKNVEKMGKICKTDDVKETIAEYVKDSFDNFLFLEGFNCWCEKLKEKNENFLNVVVGSGVASELLSKITEASAENKFLICQIISFCLNFKAVASPEVLVQQVLTMTTHSDAIIQEFCEVWIAKLLLFQPDSTISPFLQVLSDYPDPAPQYTLINSILKASGDKSTQFTLHDQLISNHFFRVLSDNLIKSCQNPSNFTEKLWAKSFECLEKILNNENFLYKDTEIKFDQLAEFLTQNSLDSIRENIVSSSYKYLKRIVISPNYTFFRLPAGIPLLLAYLSQEYPQTLARTRMKFENMLKTSTNLNNSIKHGLISYLISSLSSSTATLLWSNPYKTLAKSLSIHYSIPNLRQTLDLLETCQDTAQKLSLLESINDALSYSPEKTSNFSFNSKNFLKVFFEPGHFIIQNEFSVVIWFFPDCRSKSILCTIDCSPDKFTVKIVKEQVILVINELEYAADEIICVNSWNLLSVSFKFTKVARMVKSKILTIGVNGVLKDFNENNKLGFAQKNEIKCLSLCSEFIGKVSGVYFYSFRIKKQHLEFLLNLSPGECPHFLTNSLKYMENKQCQELKDSLLYYCTKESVLRFPYTQSTVFCDTFNWTSISQCIQSYGPSVFLIKILTSCEQEPEMITKLYEIVSQLISSKTFEVSEEFIQILSCFGDSYYWDERVFEVFVMILRKLPENFAKLLFDGLFLRISEYSGKYRHISSLAKQFIDLYPLNRENLYKFSLLIKNCDRNVIRKCLEEYVGNNVENKMTEIITYVLVALLNIKQVDVIQGFLDLIQGINTNLWSFTATCTVLLHILEKIEDDCLKILIIKALCLKNYNKDEESQMNIMIFMVDEVIPNELSPKLNKFLLENALNPLHKHLVSEGLFAIVAKRLKFVKKNENFQDFLRILNEFPEKIKSVIYDSSLFPDCFLGITENSDTAKTVKLILVEIFYQAGKQEEFDKFSIYLKEKPQISLFHKLMHRFPAVHKETLYEFINILKEIPRHGLKFDQRTYIKILNHLTSPEFLKVYLSSMNLKKILQKKTKTPMKKLEKLGLKYKFILIEMLQTLFNTLNFLPQNPEIFLDIIEKVLNYYDWFNKYMEVEDHDEKLCEVLVSIYVFVELINIYEEKNVDISRLLLQFIEKNRVFSKIFVFLDNKSNIEVLQRFDKMPSNYAILSQQSIIDSVSDWTSLDICPIPKTIFLDYSLLVSYAKSSESEYKKNNSLSFLANNEWQEVYEKLQTIIKNFKKSINHLYRTSIEGTYSISPSTFADYQKVLVEILENPWVNSVFEEFERIASINSRKVEKFSINLEKMRNFLHSPVLSNKIRQVYDGCYRWTMLKYQFNKKKKISSLSEIKIRSRADSLRGSYLDLSLKPSFLYTKPGFRCEIELIKVQGSFYGIFEISDSFIQIKFEDALKPAHHYPTSTPSCLSKSKTAEYNLPFSSISEIFPHKTVHKSTSLEFILTSGKSLLLNFFSEQTRSDILSRLKNTSSLLQKSEAKYLESLTTDWKKHKISNFSYIMIINKLAGRCLNDLSQYPVFPWIYINFEKFNLAEISNFRKLSLPIGAQTKEMQKEAKKRFKASEQDFGPFHYGSHYSSPAAVCYYLLRIQPYTEQSKAIQGGQLDKPDRLFQSIKSAWNSCMNLIGDVKELIPELYFQEFTLKNAVYCEFGMTQSKKTVTDVELPQWASSSLDFIRKNKVALESNFVSDEINNWIDLVFGYKQLGKASFEAFNAFSSTAREDSFKELCEKFQKFEKSFVDQAYHFGINPRCLFREGKHVKREELRRMHFLEKRYLEGVGKMGKVKKKNECRGRVQALFGGGRRVWLVKRVRDEYYLVKFHTMQGADKFLSSKEYVLEHFYRSDDRFYGNSFALFDEKFLVSAFSITNSLVIHSTKGKIMFSVTCHTEKITSVACNSQLIFSASSDSTIFSWKLQENIINPQRPYFGHSSSVVQIAVIDTYMLLISISEQGLILIHDFRSSFIIRTIKDYGSLLATSELGLFVVGNEKMLNVWTVNAKNIQQICCEDKVKMVKFNELGDTFLQICEEFVVFRDPIVENFENKVKIQGVQDAVFGYGDRVLFNARNKIRDKRVEVCSLYIVQQTVDS